MEQWLVSSINWLDSCNYFFIEKNKVYFINVSGTFIIYTKLLITRGKDLVVLRNDCFYETLFWNKNSADSVFMKG